MQQINIDIYWYQWWEAADGHKITQNVDIFWLNNEILKLTFFIQIWIIHCNMYDITIDF